MAGVDVVATDISVPLEEQQAVVVEVNAAPGLRMHLQPSVGISRPVGEAIVSTLFPDGQDGRIPIAAVTGCQRQDNHHAVLGPHSPWRRPPRGHDLHRRHLRGRATDRHGRLQRSQERRVRPDESLGRGCRL